jgi:hypothetical protein
MYCLLDVDDSDVCPLRTGTKDREGGSSAMLPDPLCQADMVTRVLVPSDSAFLAVGALINWQCTPYISISSDRPTGWFL